MKNPIRPVEGSRYTYDPVSWDLYDPKPFAGGDPIPPRSTVTVIGGVGGRWKSLGKATLKFVWVRDEEGREQSVLPGSLQPVRKLSMDAEIMKAHLGIGNPHTSTAKYWHFRVHDPAEFDPHSFRTITPGGSERVRFVIARRPAANAMDVQKILLLKSAFPKADRAESYANLLIRRGVSAQNPPGTPTEMNPSDEEMPRIYGKTHKITMTKTDGKYRGQKFYHKFGVGVEQHGLPEGTRLKLPSGRELEVPRRSILLTGPKSLWGRYI